MNRRRRRRAEAQQRVYGRRLQKSAGKAIRTCGSCSLCCKLVGVDALDKSEDVWCPHACPDHGGCSIYASRPASCRNFVCGWLSGTPAFGDEWFPARCKMVVAPRLWKGSIREGRFVVRVDPDYPNAWQQEPYFSQLRIWAQGFPIFIRVGQRGFLLNADGTEREVLLMANRGQSLQHARMK